MNLGNTMRCNRIHSNSIVVVSLNTVTHFKILCLSCQHLGEPPPSPSSLSTFRRTSRSIVVSLETAHNEKVKSFAPKEVVSLPPINLFLGEIVKFGF